MPHALVSPRQRGRAKQLRRTMTRAELLLWQQLKAHRIDGLGFRRQVPIGRYIADFVCHQTWLIVELDGESHDFEDRQRANRARDAWFASQGFTVLRFVNDDVMRNLEGVVTVIRDAARSPLQPPPSLSLPHKGGGDPQTSAVRRVRSKAAHGEAS